MPFPPRLHTNIIRVEHWQTLSKSRKERTSDSLATKKGSFCSQFTEFSTEQSESKKLSSAKEMHPMHGVALHEFSFWDEKRRGNIPRGQFSCISTNLCLEWCETRYFSLKSPDSLAINIGFVSEPYQIILHCAIFPSSQSMSTSLI